MQRQFQPKKKHQKKKGPVPPVMNYPAIGPHQFSYHHLIRNAIEKRKLIVVELTTGETLQVTVLREDMFTFTVLLKDEIRILYKHAVKFLIFSKD